MYLYLASIFTLHFAMASWAIYHNLLFKRDSKAALGWIMISLLVPYFGPAAYYFFGINRIRRKATGIRKGMLQIDYEIASNLPEQSVKTPLYGIQAIGQRVSGRPLIDGNHVTAYHNGDEAYPAMLDAINQARRSVFLISYIFNSDSIGEQFIVALNAAKQRGVEVKVIVDGIGELYSWRRSSVTLKKCGIDVVRFLPPTLIPPSVHINLRNHRKLLVVDDNTAFLGGMNISSGNMAHADKARAITDLHFKVSGPSVAQLSELFHYDWQYAQKSDVPERSVIESAPAGDMKCRLIPDGPDEDLDALAVTIETMISSATKSVSIMTPYFIPTREMISAIQSASIRGVDVKVVLPQQNNLIYMHWANQNLLAELLNWGVQIRYQPAPFCHTKLICIDNAYSLIGSANIDQRSLRLNFELGLEVFSEDFNQQLSTHFNNVFEQSQAITFAQLASRSVLVRLRDSLTSMLSPYL